MPDIDNYNLLLHVLISTFSYRGFNALIADTNNTAIVVCHYKSRRCNKTAEGKNAWPLLHTHPKHCAKRYSLRTYSTLHALE